MAIRAVFGRDLTDAEFRAAEALLDEAGEAGAPLDYQERLDWIEERYASAILAGVEREVDDTLDLIYAETDDAELAIALSYEAQFAREAALAQEGGGGSDAFARDAGEGAGRSGAGDSDPFEQGQQIAQLPDSERAPFLNPQGEAIARQAESLEHDLRMSVDRRLVPVERTTEPPREGVLRGEEGMMVGEGDIVQTATGRETTPGVTCIFHTHLSDKQTRNRGRAKLTPAKKKRPAQSMGAMADRAATMRHRQSLQP